MTAKEFLKALSTAAHCVYDKSLGGFAESVTLYPARTENATPYGTYYVKNIIIFDHYRTTDRAALDSAILDLGIGEDISSHTGAFGFTTSMLVDEAVTLNGYPTVKGYSQWYSTGTIEYFFPRYSVYTMISSGGQSGGPVYNSSEQVVAVVSGNGLGKKVDTEFYNLMYKFRNMTYYGDVNGDDSIDIFDATLIQRYYSRLTTLTAEELERADVNGDGIVNLFDSLTVRSYIAGNEIVTRIGEPVL